MSGWRTIVTRGYEQMILRDGQMLLIEDEKELAVPMEQIREVLITSPKGSLSLPLLNAFAENNVNVVLCNDRYLPSALLLPVNRHSDAAGCVMDQAAWGREEKDKLWAEVAAAKIEGQSRLLRRLRITADHDPGSYAADIRPGDPTNREGQAARVYFHALFGDGFRRHAEDDVNAGLNYGYAILLSMAVRTLTAHGYNTALGFHHYSRDNPFNLACDVMEPFRPFADRIVYEHNGAPLDWPYKQELISLFQGECRYDGAEVKIEAAIEAYALDCVKTLNHQSEKPGVIDFV